MKTKNDELDKAINLIVSLMEEQFLLSLEVKYKKNEEDFKRLEEINRHIHYIGMSYEALKYY